MENKYPKIGDKVWVLRVRPGRKKRVANYETASRQLQKATVIGYEILLDSPTGRKKPIHGNEYLYRGELYDFFPTYYGLVDELGKRIFEPCTLNTHFQDVHLTYKDGLKDLISELETQHKELKYCIDKKYRTHRGRKNKRLLKKLESKISRLKLEYESLPQ